MPHILILSFSSARFYANGAPVRCMCAEFNLFKTSIAHHFFDFLARKALLQPGTETIQCIRAHYIE